MANSKDLRVEKRKLVEDARVILNTAEAEKRQLTAEENSKYEAIMKDVDSRSEMIDRMEKQEALEKDAVSTIITTETRNIPESEIQIRALNRALCDGIASLKPEEVRALQVDKDTSGGYIVMPQQWVNQLITTKDNLTFMRQLATKFSVPDAQSLGAPSLAADPADPTWTAELKIGSEDSTMKLGKRELFPHPLAQFIKLSNTLLRKASMGAEALVRQRLSYKQAVVEENAFLNGTGANSPLGVFAASDDGISTDRDVSTGNTISEIRFDGLIEAKYKLPQQYRANCRWIFHRDAVKQIRKLKDGEGRYVWESSVQAGTPDRILGYPVFESEYAPSTFSTGKYVGILGDFGYYWIADALDITIQKLVELYAATNQAGFIIRSETDGMPVLEDAFVRVKLA
jgi:HK97 family phage major capsid protein